MLHAADLPGIDLPSSRRRCLPLWSSGCYSQAARICVPACCHWQLGWRRLRSAPGYSAAAAAALARRPRLQGGHGKSPKGHEKAERRWVPRLAGTDASAGAPLAVLGERGPGFDTDGRGALPVPGMTPPARLRPTSIRPRGYGRYVYHCSCSSCLRRGLYP